MTGSNNGERSPSPDFVRDSLASSSVVSVSDTGSESDDATVEIPPYAPSVPRARYAGVEAASLDPTEEWWAYVLAGV